MTDLLEAFHAVLRDVQPFQVALAICGLLVLTIAYARLSEVQRSQRVPLIVCASFSLALMVAVAIGLNLYGNAQDAYAAGSELAHPRLPEAVILMALVAYIFIVVLCLVALGEAWDKSTTIQRSTLILGTLTLVSASTSVAAGCWSYWLMSDGALAAFMNQVKLYGRDIAVILGLGFGILAAYLASQAIMLIQAGVNYGSTAASDGQAEQPGDVRSNQE